MILVIQCTHHSDKYNHNQDAKDATKLVLPKGEHFYVCLLILLVTFEYTIISYYSFSYQETVFVFKCEHSQKTPKHAIV